MFSTGQWIFAALFVIGFIISMVFAYRQDKPLHQKFYQGSSWILVGFLIFIALLFAIKFIFKH